MIDRLLLFGATGDLAGRFLLPALAELRSESVLPGSFEVVGTGRERWSDDDFRRHAATRLGEHARDVPAAAREELLARLHYCHVDLGSSDAPAEVRAVLERWSSDPSADASRPVVAYLALPPRFFVPAVTVLDEVGLPRGSRIVVEKPFGASLHDARALNRLLRHVVGDAGERAVFRVDHVLGMSTVHNLLGVRLANRIIEPLWNATHVDQVEILWEETLALEGRAGYYDRAGALKDVMQNHMLQILSLVAMEPPLSLDERDLRDRKVEALRTRRCTETFAEVTLTLDSWRWAGTRFVLRTGKAMARRRKGVIVRFRPVPHLPFDAPTPCQNELRIGLDGPESLTLHLTGSEPGPPAGLAPLVLEARLPAAELRAYSQVLLDVLNGESTLSIRGDEAEEAWRIMTPVLDAWTDDLVPLEEYPAGSMGPT